MERNVVIAGRVYARMFLSTMSGKKRLIDGESELVALWRRCQSDRLASYLLMAFVATEAW
ncbi:MULTISPECIES: hypothetical protein [unclassified Bradyrhizobium]|uniref:hypothetical protein n=1 Tax=unclassified Bradyrhizobium TaxID=2631580 RepID=UPI0033912B40